MTRAYLTCIALMSAAVLAPAQSSSLKKDMHGAYDGLSAAYNKKDTGSIIAWTAPDYKWTLLDGKVLNRDASKSAIKDQFDKTVDGNWRIDILNVIGAGPIASVVVRVHFVGTMIDPSKKLYRVDLTSTERDTWLKSGGFWRQTSAETLSQTSVTGGKKVTGNVDSAQTPNPPKKA